MAEVFDNIVGGGYFQPFSNLSAEQDYCKKFTTDNLEELLSARQREKYIDEVRVCTAGFGPADEKEPMEDSNFSQFQFYKPFTEDLIFFVDKFDFLIKCVSLGVCKVANGFEDRFIHTLLQVLTFKELTKPPAPEYVLDLRTLSTPRIVSEQHRTKEEQDDHFQSYLKRRNSYANSTRSELERLEQEQYEYEQGRGQHRSLMGWEREDHDYGVTNEQEKKEEETKKRDLVECGTQTNAEEEQVTTKQTEVEPEEEELPPLTSFDASDKKNISKIQAKFRSKKPTSSTEAAPPAAAKKAPKKNPEVSYDVNFHITGCKNLLEVPGGFGAHSYVLMKDKEGKHILETPTVDDTLCPVWNEADASTTLKLLPKQGGRVTFEVWNSCIAADEFLGCYRWTVADLFEKGNGLYEFPLAPRPGESDERILKANGNLGAISISIQLVESVISTNNSPTKNVAAPTTTTNADQVAAEKPPADNDEKKKEEETTTMDEPASGNRPLSRMSVEEHEENIRNEVEAFNYARDVINEAVTDHLVEDVSKMPPTPPAEEKEEGKKSFPNLQILIGSREEKETPMLAMIMQQ